MNGEFNQRMESTIQVTGLDKMILESKEDLTSEFELTGQILQILSSTLIDVRTIDLHPSKIQDTLSHSKLNLDLKDLKSQDATAAKELICKTANEKIFKVAQLETLHPIDKKWAQTEMNFKEKYPTFSWKS
jgi:hypothetical protein